MSEAGLGFVLDALILILLATTIYYAARLAIYLKSFRDGRADLEKLIQRLSENIAQAERAIEGMHISAEEAGHSLQDLINESKFLSDELRFMNEAGDGLASRLEKLAERNRELVELLEGAGGIGHLERQEEALLGRKSFSTKASQKSQKVQQNQDVSEPFSIRDPEFEEEDYIDEDTNSEEPFEMDVERAPDESLHSQAERELYDALKKTRKRKPKSRAGGVG